MPSLCLTGWILDSTVKQTLDKQEGCYPPTPPHPLGAQVLSLPRLPQRKVPLDCLWPAAVVMELCPSICTQPDDKTVNRQKDFLSAVR